LRIFATDQFRVSHARICCPAEYFVTIKTVLWR